MTQEVTKLFDIGKHKFQVGQRVRPSKDGQDANIFKRKHWNTYGIVTKVDEYNSPSVLWTHRKTSSSYYPGFIEPVVNTKVPECVN